MTQKKKTPKFNLTLKVVAIVEAEVEADTFEQALEYGKELETSDIIKLGDSATGFMDYSKPKLIAVNTSNEWGTDL